ncbi:hypothetical protein D3C74_377390 [compost metagenome]
MFCCDAGELPCQLGIAFQLIHIHRCHDTDVVSEQKLNVLQPASISSAISVTMCQTIHQHHLRITLQECIQVQILHLCIITLAQPVNAWNPFECAKLLYRFRSAHRRYGTDDHINALVAQRISFT